MAESGDVQDLYVVVLNDEGQHSIWLMDKPLPDGWHASGFVGDEDACIAHVEMVWQDMRPASLQRAMEAQSGVPDAG